MSASKHPTRRVTARHWALAGTVAASAIAAGHPATAPYAPLAPAFAETGEGGESGEAGVVLTEGPAEFLTRLGYFEGTYRIAARLYLTGEREAAAAHLDESHHAFYEDIEEQIDTYSAPGFVTEAEAFTKAVMNDAGDDTVQSAYDALMAKVGENAAASGASRYDQIISLHDLLNLAAVEYEGGVYEGTVDVPIEYRDSWGFAVTVRDRAKALAEGDDEALAQAGHDILEQLDGIDALFPSLTAETAATDASQLAVAAGWTEIYALRLK